MSNSFIKLHNTILGVDHINVLTDIFEESDNYVIRVYGHANDHYTINFDLEKYGITEATRAGFREILDREKSALDAYMLRGNFRENGAFFRPEDIRKKIKQIEDGK
jgi:hypothetical protein